MRMARLTGRVECLDGDGCTWLEHRRRFGQGAQGCTGQIQVLLFEFSTSAKGRSENRRICWATGLTWASGIDRLSSTLVVVIVCSVDDAHAHHRRHHRLRTSDEFASTTRYASHRCRSNVVSLSSDASADAAAAVAAHCCRAMHAVTAISSV